MRGWIRTIPICIFALAAACSTTRVLDEGAYLFTGNEIEMNSPEDVKDRPVKKAVEQYAEQETNKKFIGLIPFGLWFYNLPGDSVPDSGLKHWIKYGLGEPPVLFRGSQVDAAEERIGSVLENRGFFHYRISPEQETNGRKLTVVYHIDLEQPYIIRNVQYPEPEDTLTSLITSFREGSLIEAGERYDLSLLEQERERIITRLKRRGFYHLLPAHLYFRLDSITDQRYMDVRLALREDMPPEAREMQYIHSIYIHHGVAAGYQEEPGDTAVRNGIGHIHPERRSLKIPVLERTLLLEEGERYDEQDYQRTLSRLSGLGVYRFVNIRFEEPQDAERTGIDAHIYLTDARKYRLQAELQAVSKSNDFVGPGLMLSYINRNLKRTATSIRTDLNAGFETQISRSAKGINSLELGANAELDLPRILAPGMVSNLFRENPYTPKTRIRAGYNYFNRSNLFAVNSLNASYGFRWEQTAVHANDLKIFSLDYLRLSNVSPELEGSSLLRRTYNEQFILLARYGFTLNDLAIQRKTNHYFHFSVESAGSTVSLADNILGGGQDREGQPSGLFGIPYAQYGRFVGDYRIHFNISSRNKLVGRTFIGVGIPYGNSEYLPYKKQFYSGGTTSLRGFPSRSVGPGSQDPGDTLTTKGFYEQTGDMKLEMNLEYRFPIYRFLKGAFFVDVGNIWLVREDPEKSGAVFRFSGFLDQLAAGPGAGLRFDLTVLVLRLDVAFPVRKPYLPEGERWVFDEIGFASPVWRKENLVYNIAIGYPF